MLTVIVFLMQRWGQGVTRRLLVAYSWRTVFYCGLGVLVTLVHPFPAVTPVPFAAVSIPLLLLLHVAVVVVVAKVQRPASHVVPSPQSCHVVPDDTPQK